METATRTSDSVGPAPGVVARPARGQAWVAHAAGIAAVAITALGGCGAVFAPPGRTDLDFGAARLARGGAEVQFGVTSPDDGVGQVGYRHALGRQDSFELSAVHHGDPGRRYGFSLAGASYRRQLALPHEPVQASIGFGAAGGVGGSFPSWSKELLRFPPVMAAWLDTGAAWRPWRWLTFYAAGRVQRTTPLDDAEADQPPRTDWLHVGGGARLDAWPWFATLDFGHASAASRDRDERFRTWTIAIGAQLGPRPRR